MGNGRRVHEKTVLSGYFLCFVFFFQSEFELINRGIHLVLLPLISVYDLPQFFAEVMHHDHICWKFGHDFRK